MKSLWPEHIIHRQKPQGNHLYMLLQIVHYNAPINYCGSNVFNHFVQVKVKLKLLRCFEERIMTYDKIGRYILIL